MLLGVGNSCCLPDAAAEESPLALRTSPALLEAFAVTVFAELLAAAVLAVARLARTLAVLGQALLLVLTVAATRFMLARTGIVAWPTVLLGAATSAEGLLSLIALGCCVTPDVAAVPCCAAAMALPCRDAIAAAMLPRPEKALLGSVVLVLLSATEATVLLLLGGVEGALLASLATACFAGCIAVERISC